MMQYSRVQPRKQTFAAAARNVRYGPKADMVIIIPASDPASPLHALFFLVAVQIATELFA